jgi:hypothetical protein
MNSAGPTAIHERHRASGRRPSTATIACPNCGIHQPVEVEYDGDQGYGALPVTPCSVCHQDLCCFCDQASCECGLTVCLHCIVTVPDGTSAGLRLCKPCAQQTDPRCLACGEFARIFVLAYAGIGHPFAPGCPVSRRMAPGWLVGPPTATGAPSRP